MIANYVLFSLLYFPSSPPPQSQSKHDLSPQSQKGNKKRNNQCFAHEKSLINSFCRPKIAPRPPAEVYAPRGTWKSLQLCYFPNFVLNVNFPIFLVNTLNNAVKPENSENSKETETKKINCKLLGNTQEKILEQQRSYQLFAVLQSYSNG